MPRARKHPDAVPAEVASEWLEDAATFLKSAEGQGLGAEARESAIRLLRSTATGNSPPLKMARAARDSARKAAAFLEKAVSPELSPDAQAYAVQYLMAVAAGKPLTFKRGAPGTGRAQEAADHVQDALLSGQADTLTTAYKIAAQRMNLDSKTGPREIKRYCSKVWGHVRPVPLLKLRAWLHQDS